jgi:hypothetical protein
VCVRAAQARHATGYTREQHALFQRSMREGSFREGTSVPTAGNQAQGAAVKPFQLRVRAAGGLSRLGRRGALAQS